MKKTKDNKNTSLYSVFEVLAEAITGKKWKRIKNKTKKKGDKNERLVSK